MVSRTSPCEPNLNKFVTTYDGAQVNNIKNLPLEGERTMSKLIPVVLVGRSRLFRDGLKSLLKGANIEIVKELNGVDEAAGTSDDCNGQHVLIFDAGSRPQQLPDVIERLKNEYPENPVLILADELEWQPLIDAIRAGANGYLLKDISTEALVISIRLVHLGEKVFPTNLASLLVKGTFNLVRSRNAERKVRGLSDREALILRSLVDGESNKMIARHLNITEATVKVHLKGLMRKIDCSNRTQAAIWALTHGVGEPDSSDAECEDDDFALERIHRHSGDQNFIRRSI